MRSEQARKVIDALSGDLAANAETRRVSLSWSPREEQLIDQLGDTIDRRVEIATVYAKAAAVGEDPRTLIKLSAEIRQLDRAIQLLLRDIETDVPQPESVTTQKARMAANKRWADARDREAR